MIREDVCLITGKGESKRGRSCPGAVRKLVEPRTSIYRDSAWALTLSEMSKESMFFLYILSEQLRLKVLFLNEDCLHLENESGRVVINLHILDASLVRSLIGSLDSKISFNREKVKGIEVSEGGFN